MENSFYRFPAMARLENFDNLEQMRHIRLESEEATNSLLIATFGDASRDYESSRIDYGMELMDVIHATETALRMEFTDDEVAELRYAVEKKNRDRGYYALLDDDGVEIKIGDIVYEDDSEYREGE